MNASNFRVVSVQFIVLLYLVGVSGFLRVGLLKGREGDGLIAIVTPEERKSL